MNKRQRQKTKARAEPQKRETQKTVSWLCSKDAFDILTCQGYTSLAHNPEIATAVDRIARLVGSMTIHLMQNTDEGDVRVKNELSRKIDINPNKNMVRSQFIQWIVKTMYLYGDGNAVIYPKFSRGYLRDLNPVPASMVSFVPEGIWDYKVYPSFRIKSRRGLPMERAGVQSRLKRCGKQLEAGSRNRKGVHAV